MTSVPNLKYKTTLCNNWTQQQQCVKGDNCFFAHGYEQLRTMEQNHELIIKKQQHFRAQKPKNNPSANFKTVFCKFYKKGQCMLGQKCTFIHDHKQRRVPRAQKIQENRLDMSWHQYSEICWLKANNPNFLMLQNSWQNFYYNNAFSYEAIEQRNSTRNYHNISFEQNEQKTQTSPNK